jgi:5-hydroxyisourate hydrolase
MNSISTHVLDTAKGKPASGLPIRLEIKEGESWKELASGKTNADGRLPGLLPEGQSPKIGVYRMTFDTAAYNPEGFYPQAVIEFQIRETAQHYHIPLLLSPFGYSTYRGS